MLVLAEGFALKTLECFVPAVTLVIECCCPMLNFESKWKIVLEIFVRSLK